MKLYVIFVVVLVVDRISILLVIGVVDGVIKIWDIVGGYVIYIVSGLSVFILVLYFFEIVVIVVDIIID